MPSSSRKKSVMELRTNFKRPLADTESIEDRLKQANDRISLLRITLPKPIRRTSTSAGNIGGVFVQTKDGRLVEASQAGTSTRDSNGRVVSNWDGKNLDPCQVKRHNVSLKRAGFVNNTHAKGIF